MDEGELEIGQVSALIKEILPTNEIIRNLITEYRTAVETNYQ
jgi:enoyl-[acyl-carrier protein] reductase II